MKRIVFLIFSLSVSLFSLFAQNAETYFGGHRAEIKFSAAVYRLPADSVFDSDLVGFHAHTYDSGQHMYIDANNSRFGNAENYNMLNYRLKTGGTTHNGANYIVISVPTDGILHIAVRTGNNADTTRTLVVEQDNDTLFNQVIRESNAIRVMEDTIEIMVYPYISIYVEKGDVVLSYPTGALNFYGFAFVFTKITLSTNPPDAGSINVSDTSLIVTPNYGYHFSQWSDGNTDNPRIIEITQDTTFTAEFVLNKYNIAVTYDNTQGSIEGDSGDFDYLTELTYIAISNYGYHFDHWNLSDTLIENDYKLLWDYSTSAPKSKPDHGLYYSSKVSDTYLKGIKLNSTGYCYFTKEAVEGILELTFCPRVEGDTSSLKIETWDDSAASSIKPTSLSLITTTQEVTVLTTVSVVLTESQNNIFIERLKDKETVLQKIQFTPYKYADTLEFTVTKNDTIEAIFAPNNYSLSATPTSNGEVSGTGSFAYLTECSIEAIPNYGYHFVQWSDGNTDNPRTITLIRDSVFTVEFAANQYTITDNSDMVRGTIEGTGTFDYLTECELTAVPKYGYHFTQWSDGNTDNPRTITLTKDSTFIVEFAKNTYSITNDAINGTIYGNSAAEYLDEVTLTATPNYGYHFVQWNDGNTDNPRTIILTQDTTFTVDFSVNMSGRCGDSLTWSLTDDTLTIVGSGDMWDEQPWVGSRTEISYVNLPQGLTSIGKYAFEYCSLKTIEIPDSVISIGDRAFSNCDNLNFIIIPDSVTSVGTYAFRNCDSLASVTIGKNMTSISDLAFYNCTNITSVIWKAKDCSRCSFGSQVTSFIFGEEVEVIPNFICSGMNQLATITIPNSVTDIEWDAFYNCSSLASVTIGYSVTGIGYAAFMNCSSLTSIEIPNSVTSVGDNAFLGCSALMSVTIGNNVANIGSGAFRDCAKLTTITIPASVTEIGSFAFMNGNRLQTIILGSGIETIGERAFANCPYILTIHAYMEFPPIINANVFEDCGDLSGVDCYVQESSLALSRKTNVWKEFHLLVETEPETTGIDDITIDDLGDKSKVSTRKIFYNGQFFILRGDKIYTMTGEKVR